MINIGRYATLRVVKKLSFGLYLDGGPFGEILLPVRYAPKDLEPEQEIEVFLYTDSEDRIIATTEKPYAVDGEFAYLQVVDAQPQGAFMDWGLLKDLFVPIKGQAEPMEAGKRYVVKVYLDVRTDRMVGSSKLENFLVEQNQDLTVGEEVNLLVYRKTNLGYKVVVNNMYSGILFANEVFQPLQAGMKLKGYVKNIREDLKIDLTLQKSGYQNRIPDAVSDLLQYLEKNDGFLPLTDSSAPEDIYKLLKMSKKAFKKAVGSLYKEKKITLTPEGINAVSK